MSLNSVRDGGDVSHEPRNNSVCSGLNALGSVARSSLSRRCSAVHWRSLEELWTGKEVVHVLVVFVDQRGNDSVDVRHPLDLRTSLQLLDLFSAVCRRTFTREVPSITQSYNRIA